jgi:hypothetical protein
LLAACGKVGKGGIVVTPQEYFGGLQTVMLRVGASGWTDDDLVYSQDRILDLMYAATEAWGCGLILGALIRDSDLGQTRERVYCMDPVKGLVGYFDKMWLPAYDHIGAGSPMRVSPETNIDLRARSVVVCGVRVSVLFCWEVYSNAIWNALRRAEPDVLVSMIKFGVRSWPSKVKAGDTSGFQGKALVKGFGFGDDGGWIDRLRLGALYDVAAPIVLSTNSWDLPKRSWPLCGTILPFEEPDNGRLSSLELPQKGTRGLCEEVIRIDTLDYLYWRLVRENKHKCFQETGEWPSGVSRRYTMMWKIRRMERKLGLL